MHISPPFFEDSQGRVSCSTVECESVGRQVILPLKRSLANFCICLVLLFGLLNLTASRALKAHFI